MPHLNVATGSSTTLNTYQEDEWTFAYCCSLCKSFLNKNLSNQNTKPLNFLHQQSLDDVLNNSFLYYNKRKYKRNTIQPATTNQPTIAKRQVNTTEIITFKFCIVSIQTVSNCSISNALFQYFLIRQCVDEQTNYFAWGKHWVN